VIFRAENSRAAGEENGKKIRRFRVNAVRRRIFARRVYYNDGGATPCPLHSTLRTQKQCWVGRVGVWVREREMEKEETKIKIKHERSRRIYNSSPARYTA